MIRITLVSNAIHLEAARRLRRRSQLPGREAAAPPRRTDLRAADPAHPQADAAASPPPPRRAGRDPLLELLVYEPERMVLNAADRRLWPLRAPVSPALMAALTVPALFGLVSELRLSHLCRVGRALQLLARHARRLVLLDDGLDQYRARPRAVDPLAFPPGTPCWLFSDRPQDRADWCHRFACHELGPLYDAPERSPAPRGEAARGVAAITPSTRRWRSLILDAPGLERQDPRLQRLPHPWLLLAHPVVAKRSWCQPSLPGDGTAADLGPGFAPGSAERLLAEFHGTVVVGESMTLLAAARLRPAGSPLLVALPPDVDPNLRRLALSLAAEDATIEVL